jgi:subtilase family serine protease
MRRDPLFPGSRARAPRARFVRPQLEILEDRVVPSADPSGGFAGYATPGVEVANPGAVSSLGGPGQPGGSGQPGGFSPQQIRHAYGFDGITFNGGTAGNGAGQTIAIVDAYSQPNIANDLAVFDQTYGLPAANLTVVNQRGGSSLPPADGGWGLEISLDVEWAHAMAPGANILLVETDSNTYTDLMAGVDYARNQPGVSVVSMSWGGGEWSSESYFDHILTTPAGHNGVTFIAASGDSGSGGAPIYPSVSPSVLAVGGTQLTTDVNGNYLGEVGWAGSGGGISIAESQPSYQHGMVTQTSAFRAVPDVSYNASGSSPFAVRNGGGWIGVYGTSAGAPQWAALLAIANQGRALAGQGSLDGLTQTLPMLYHLPQSDFHDITAGGNGGYAAGPGYDLVTGRGSPIADRIIAGLIPQSSDSPHPPQVVSPATASANPVTGTTTNLSVRGNDNSGATSLTYNWSLRNGPSGVAAPTASVNGTNAAQNTTITFYAAGVYTFQVVITDPAGHTASSTVTVTVNQTLSGLVLTPIGGNLLTGGALQFKVTAVDQFGHAMSVQPKWSLSGPGSLDSNGRYTAPAFGIGQADIQVSVGGLTRSATAIFAPPPPQFLLRLLSFLNPSDPWSAWWGLVDWLQSFWQSLLVSRHGS